MIGGDEKREELWAEQEQYFCNVLIIIDQKKFMYTYVYNQYTVYSTD